MSSNRPAASLLPLKVEVRQHGWDGRQEAAAQASGAEDSQAVPTTVASLPSPSPKRSLSEFRPRSFHSVVEYSGVNPFAQGGPLSGIDHAREDPSEAAEKGRPDAAAAGSQYVQPGSAEWMQVRLESPGLVAQGQGVHSAAPGSAVTQSGPDKPTVLGRATSDSKVVWNGGLAPENQPNSRTPKTPRRSSRPPAAASRAGLSPSSEEVEVEMARKVNFDYEQQFGTFIERTERRRDPAEEPISYASSTDMFNPAKLRTKGGKFYSQPLAPGISHSEVMRRHVSMFSDPLTARSRGPGHGEAKSRANDYKMFRTGSRHVERAESGKTTRDDRPPNPQRPEASIMEPEITSHVSAGRYFDALEGPEFEVLKDSEDLLLPLDQQWPFLLRFPIGCFGITMGLGSQAILWKTLASSASMEFIQIPVIVNISLWCLALTTLVLISCIYLCKAIYYFEAVRREFSHPVRVNFFFAPWIACMFLTLGLPHNIATHIHPAIWCVFMAPIFVLELKIYGQWLSGGDRKLSKVANPSTHLSVVGNFVGAVLGAQVGWKEPATFFWAVGLAHYLVVFVTLYQRLPTNEALPKELHPVFFLFVAAPSTASVAWTRITGDFGNTSKIVYFMALFLYTSLVVRLNFFRGFRFSIAWWAYTFPMTAASIATIEYSKYYTHPITQAMAVVLSVISSCMVIMLFVSTCLHAFVWGTLFPNDLAIAITVKKRKRRRKGKDSSDSATTENGNEDLHLLSGLNSNSSQSSDMSAKPAVTSHRE